MNQIIATVDTQVSSYSSIGNINALDDVELTLEVLTSGVVDAHWTSPVFELIGFKADKNEVRQTDGFEVLDLSTRKVKIKLKEQFLTCPGMLKLQLIIKDSGRTSSTVFYLYIGQSLEQESISIRDVEVFDQLDLYVAQGFRAISEATEITGQLKEEMTAINDEASISESERQASELTRNQRELVRVDNEEDRVANEIERVANENERVTNEEERKANENTRITNENNRRTHENTRITQETARQEAERQRNTIFEENENIRNEQENTRIKFENERKKKFTTWEERETTRLKSEENRILQEQARVSNEEERKRQELARQQQEDYRQTTYTQFNDAEANRVAKETQRQSAEQQRQQAESSRDLTYQTRENNRDIEYGKAEVIRDNAFSQNEANRQKEYTEAERQRVESEELRKGRERDRDAAETNRQQAESERVIAEQSRVTRFNQEIEKAKNTMDTAATNVNAVINVADSTMQAIEQRAEACLPVIESSASAKVDYLGTQHESIKDSMDANVEYILGEVNTVHYEGQNITATDTIEKQVRSAILSGQTKYRDTETGDILDSFDNTKKLELISVKMPVLTTRGKNLFDGKLEKGSINIDGKLENSSTMQRSVNFIKVKPNTYYTTSNSLNEYNGIRAYDENKTFISNLDVKPTFITPINCEWIKLTTTTIESVEIQIEEGETKTPYEPYKTNILSIDGTYRGIDGVQDTVDLIKSEVIQLIDETTLNGSETWVLNTDFVNETLVEFRYKPSFDIERILCSDKFLITGNAERIVFSGTLIYLKVSKSKANTVEELKVWLSQNPVVIQYKTKTPIIKTVDLNYQRVYSYDGVTHYFCSSGSKEQSLIPTLSIDVPTNLTALVSRQRATVEAQNEQIQILEVENEILIEQNEIQDLDIELNQYAINFILFTPDTMSARNINNTEGVNAMAAYFANQILKGKLDYTLVVTRYPEFQEDIDTILILEGKQDLIK